MTNWLDIVLRHSEGNPNHKGSGPGGGQFTSGPGGGAASKPHGKHFARRQRRKAKLKAKQKQVVAKHAADRKTKRREHLASLKTANTPKERSALREQYKAARAKTAASHTAERESVSTKTRASTHSPTEKAKLDRLKKGKPAEYKSEKARRAAEHQTLTTGAEQSYTKANEHAIAARLGGESFADNGAVDITVKIGGKTHGVELKTLVQGKNDKVTMAAKPKSYEKESAIDRKIKWQNENGTTVHTVVADHRDKFAGGKNKELHSGNELYYKRGTGSFRIGAMHPVKDIDELHKLMRMPYDKLPKAAQGDRRGGKT